MTVITTANNFALDVEKGLKAAPKHLPTKYIYDDKGTQLFEEIMDLPEYYLTNCEAEILKEHAHGIAEAIDDTSFNLVEFGAGNGVKTKLLLNHFFQRHLDFNYYPIDISKKAIDNLRTAITNEYPSFYFEGLIMDYFEGLAWLNKIDKKQNVVLFLGANIGNLNAQNMDVFMTNLHKSLNPKDIVVIGFDLVKDYKTIERAYNDSRGVTKAFTLNILSRINEELGGNFVLENFDHFNFYNPTIQANEAYLVSLKDQEVHIKALDQTFRFRVWEPIHTEYSFKYSLAQIYSLADKHGFDVLENLCDKKNYFCDTVWQVCK